jgi:hypothetical protein
VTEWEEKTRWRKRRVQQGEEMLQQMKEAKGVQVDEAAWMVTQREAAAMVVVEEVVVGEGEEMAVKMWQMQNYCRADEVTTHTER